MKVWTCKIGEVDEKRLPDAADSPLRRAVQDAYESLLGEGPDFCFTGWGGELTGFERAAAENRGPTKEELADFERRENAEQRIASLEAKLAEVEKRNVHLEERMQVVLEAGPNTSLAVHAFDKVNELREKLHASEVEEVVMCPCCAESWVRETGERSTYKQVTERIRAEEREKLKAELCARRLMVAREPKDWRPPTNLPPGDIVCRPAIEFEFVDDHTRNAAIEECAKVAERSFGGLVPIEDVAEAIRSLKREVETKQE